MVESVEVNPIQYNDGNHSKYWMYVKGREGLDEMRCDLNIWIQLVFVLIRIRSMHRIFFHSQVKILSQWFGLIDDCLSLMLLPLFCNRAWGWGDSGPAFLLIFTNLKKTGLFFWRHIEQMGESRWKKNARVNIDLKKRLCRNFIRGDTIKWNRVIFHHFVRLVLIENLVSFRIDHGVKSNEKDS